MIKVLSGNKAAANAVRLARPDVIAVYPITPQSPIAKELAKFHSDGDLDCELIEVEGEHTAMSAIIGAGLAGGRVFTATSSWGIQYMYEPLMYCSGMRVPAVMVDVTRETSFLRGVGGSRQDFMSMRDTGWIQIEPADCQEVLDSVLMAYRLSEDPDVLLPVMIGYDGFFLSHQYERVDVPTQEQVDRFLAPCKNNGRTTLSTDRKLHVGISIVGREFANCRYQAMEAMERAEEVFLKVEKEFEEIFGRSYGGVIDTYRADDAEILFFTAGSCSGTIKTVIDKARDKGVKVGLARQKMFRPYPKERVAEVLSGRKAVAVIERSLCTGWDCGHLIMEAKAAMANVSDSAMPKMIDFIDGLASLDITAEHLEKALAISLAAASGREVKETNWLIWE